MARRAKTHQPPGSTGKRLSESARPTVAKRGDGRAWRKFRLSRLAEPPLCERCGATGLLTPATVVHHKERHGHAPARFWAGPPGQGRYAAGRRTGPNPEAALTATPDEDRKGRG